MKPRNPFIHLLVALLLLFSQQLAAAHTVSHLSDALGEASREHSLPVDHACVQCLAFAQIGSGLVGSACSHAVPDFDEVAFREPQHAPRLASPLRAFQPRAPPFSS